MTNALRPQVLVVDDEPGIRKSLALLLTSAGYDVAVAENGAHALLQLDRMQPALIVSDLNMPQMSGLELMSQVRSLYPQILIVAMSGAYERDAVPAGVVADRFYAKGQGAHSFLTTICSLFSTSNPRWNDPQPLDS